MKRRIAAWALVLALLAGLTGCTAQTTSSEPYKVYMIVKSTTTEFWKSVFAGANAAKSEYNVDLTVLGPETEEDYETQNDYIRQAVANGADAIVFSAISYTQNAAAIDEAVAAAHCEQCRLVHKVLKIGARKAGSALGNGVEVDILRKLLVFGVDLQYRLAPADIGQADIYLTVKAAGTQQRVIQDIRSVRRRHDYDALVAAEAVHLNEQLV